MELHYCPGGDNSFVVTIHALDHCFGVTGPTRDFRSQRCHEQTRHGLMIETQVYSHEDRYLQRMVSGSAIRQAGH